jgi:UMF1 family MFS transporter
MMAITAGIGSLIFGKLADKIGHKKTMVYILVLWVVLIAILYIKTNYAIFLTAGVFGGALLGGVWTVTRPILIDLAPEDKVAELLGYQGLTEKFSGVLGPLLFGAVAVAFGFKQALLVVITLFIGGLIALNFVKKI